MGVTITLMRDIFGAYDIRGRYPGEINEVITQKIISGLSREILEKGKIVVGHDARKSSPALYRACLKVLGSRAIRAGMITTPMLYFLVNKLKAGGGIMVTASHNPKEWNGLKVAGPKAVPISGDEIEQALTNN